MRVAWAGAVLAAATILAGTLIDAGGTNLGVPMPPFLGPWNVRAHPLALLAAVVLAAAVWLAPRALTLRPGWFMAVAVAATVVVRLAVNAGRFGPDEWDRAFDLSDSFEGKNEYLPALGALRYGPRFLLDRWTELLPSLPPHAAAHPPGTLLVLDALGISTAPAMAALCIGAGALAAPLAYLAARAVAGERVARVATALLVLCPDAVLFGATSADALFLALGMLAAWPLAVFAVRGGVRPLVLGAAAMAVATLFAWSLAAVAAWAAVLALLRGGLRRALALGAACAGAAVLFYAALFAATGYDVIGALRATQDVYRFSVASMRPYAFWVFGSPVAFLVLCGLPVSWLALRALGARDRAAVAIFAVIGAAAVLGFTKAETERIWLFLAPPICLAAASALPAARLRPVLAILAVQALAIEVLFDTVW